MTLLKDRNDAGKKLAEKLEKITKGSDSIVLAIPRGGVVVGDEIAKRLGCNLDIAIAKKITPPHYPEYAIGAITHDGTIYYGSNWEKFSKESNLENEINKKKFEVKRRLEEYRGTDQYAFNNKTVILVDDGIATGSTVFVLLNWLKQRKVNRLILAIPVIPAQTFEEMKPLVNSIVTLEIPIEFSAVGQFYQNFEQVSDEVVREILDKYQISSGKDNEGR